MKKLALLAAAGALVVAVPAAAKPHPGYPIKPGHPGQSHKCVAHHVAYRASGTLVSWSLTKNGNGTYSGMLSVAVTHTNNHAKGDKGTTVTYTVSDAHVTFGSHATNPPAVGSRVQLIGKITTLAKKCDHTGFTAVTTIHHIVVHAPKTTKP
jgi:hypothetical protein